MKYDITIPKWAIDAAKELPEFVESTEDRMAIVIRLSQLNFQRNTGGPFAAGIFEKQSGRIVSLGVNRVVPCNNSSAHAEIVAISLAQARLGTFDLGGEGLPEHQIVVNARPCAMCFGAIPWSGVRSVVSAASGQQIEELTGFDEGPIHPDWRRELESRGIEVTEGVLEGMACDTFREFAATDSPIYNGRQGSK